MLKVNEYAACINASVRVAWSLDDAVSKLDFDFAKRFVPPKILGAEGIPFLSDDELRQLSHIRGFSYAHLFLFVEEYIILQVIAQSQAHLHTQPDATRALLRFAEEETKHQGLFRAVKANIQGEIGECGEIGGMADVAKFIVSKPPLSVMLLTLMLEWITQRHYLECFKDNMSIDPAFSEVFRLHWVEEAQHARIDALEIKTLCGDASAAARAQAVDVLLELLEALDGLLLQQVELDVATLERLSGRELSADQRAQLIADQHGALRWTFITSGVEHRLFLRALTEVSPEGAEKLTESARKYAA